MDATTKILVVDDDEIVRLAHQRSLAGAHCQVVAVWNGDEALAAMERQPFDVILLDLRMPGQDGLAVLRMIKDRWPDTEVVIITGYPSLQSVKEAVELGACDYLTKPVGPDEVIHAAHGAATRKKWALRRVPAAA